MARAWKSTTFPNDDSVISDQSDIEKVPKKPTFLEQSKPQICISMVDQDILNLFMKVQKSKECYRKTKSWQVRIRVIFELQLQFPALVKCDRVVYGNVFKTRLILWAGAWTFCLFSVISEDSCLRSVIIPNIFWGEMKIPGSRTGWWRNYSKAQCLITWHRSDN